MQENPSGTICWLNSIVQLLLVTIDENSQDSPLKRLFGNIQNSDQIKSNEPLRRLVAEKKPEIRHGQQDSFDLFLALTQFAASDKEWLLNPLTMYKKTTTTCKNDPNHQSSAYHNTLDFFLV